MPDPNFLSDIEAAIASGTVNQRLRALKRVTDLFAAGSARYTIEQIAVFDDVLLKLAEVVERHARAHLARRLAHMADAPPRMIRTLAFDPEIEVAGPVLKHSERLPDPDLVENARIYDLPAEPPPIMVSAFGPKAAKVAAEIGDGLVTTSPDSEAISWPVSSRRKSARSASRMSGLW